MQKIVIITPALAEANNGNWHTTARWLKFLDSIYTVHVDRTWNGQTHDLMIALHARRSAPAIAEFAQTGRPVVVVLTGTDLYRDIHHDADALRSLDLATRLVVLQPEGLRELSAQHQAKCTVIEQSADALHALPRDANRFDLTMVGHLRAEKDPITAFEALQEPIIAGEQRLRLNHIGHCNDTTIAPRVQELARQDARIRLLGALPRDASRDHIRRSAALVLPSIMEGGANVLIEAVTSDTAVLASRISGSIGLLGAGYQGFFPVGDRARLAELVARCLSEPDFLERLRSQCKARAHLFLPAREQAAVQKLAHNLLNS